jgi:dolichol-phosphate mannosyltransferase
MKKKKISIISACYNEEGNIENLVHRVSTVMQALPEYDYEHIFVDNSSTDNSREIFNKLIEQNKHITVLFMARNFGSNQPSIIAGIHQATGDCVIIIDGDIQDPPELISEFIKKWKEGYDVVYGIRKKRRGSIIRRIFYALFYRIFKFLSYIDIPLDAGDFSLMDKRIVNIIKSFPERDIYLRGLRAWVGFKQIGIEYTRDDRTAGKTSNSFFANFTWVKKAIVNFSNKPLEYVSTLASIVTVITLIASCVYLYLFFKYPAPRGFYTIFMTLLIFNSIQLLVLSVISEYLVRIFQEVKARPIYIISEVWNKDSIEKKDKTVIPISPARGETLVAQGIESPASDLQLQKTYPCANKKSEN